MEKRIGILSFQGDFERHDAVCRDLGYSTVRVRTPEALSSADALIIPGGESTTIGMLSERFGLLEPIRRFISNGGGVMGTCAGTILLADTIEKSDQVAFGGVDMVVRRNAYGRQVDSFEATIPIPSIGAEPFKGVFIRAPKILSCGDGVTILAEYGAFPVMVRQKNVLTLTFHPELTKDNRIHKYFLEKIAE